MSGSWIGSEKRKGIYYRDNCKCIYCGTSVTPGAHVSDLSAATLDHITPRNDGGTNAASNLVTACVSCNSSKQDVSKVTWGKMCADRGIDRKAMWARVRRATGKNLRPYWERAKQEAKDND